MNNFWWFEKEGKSTEKLEISVIKINFTWSMKLNSNSNNLSLLQINYREGFLSHKRWCDDPFKFLSNKWILPACSQDKKGEECKEEAWYESLQNHPANSKHPNAILTGFQDSSFYRDFRLKNCWRVWYCCQSSVTRAFLSVIIFFLQILSLK